MGLVKAFSKNVNKDHTTSFPQIKACNLKSCIKQTPVFPMAVQGTIAGGRHNHRRIGGKGGRFHLGECQATPKGSKAMSFLSTPDIIIVTRQDFGTVPCLSTPDLHVSKTFPVCEKMRRFLVRLGCSQNATCSKLMTMLRVFGGSFFTLGALGPCSKPRRYGGAVVGGSSDPLAVGRELPAPQHKTPNFPRFFSTG